MQVTNNVAEASDGKDLTLKAADTQLGMSTMTAPAGKGEGSNNKRNLKYEIFTSSRDNQKTMAQILSRVSSKTGKGRSGSK
jgi:hypothetical protein